MSKIDIEVCIGDCDGVKSFFDVKFQKCMSEYTAKTNLLSQNAFSPVQVQDKQSFWRLSGPEAKIEHVQQLYQKHIPPQKLATPNMEGKVWDDSNCENGFWFELPLSEDEEQVAYMAMTEPLQGLEEGDFFEMSFSTNLDGQDLIDKVENENIEQVYALLCSFKISIKAKVSKGSMDLLKQILPELGMIPPNMLPIVMGALTVPMEVSFKLEFGNWMEFKDSCEEDYLEIFLNSQDPKCVGQQCKRFFNTQLVQKIEKIEAFVFIGGGVFLSVDMQMPKVLAYLEFAEIKY